MPSGHPSTLPGNPSPPTPADALLDDEGLGVGPALADAIGDPLAFEATLELPFAVPLPSAPAGTFADADDAGSSPFCAV
jgi:hypothetical protein